MTAPHMNLGADTAGTEPTALPAHRRILDYLEGIDRLPLGSKSEFKLLSGGNSHITWRLRLDQSGDGDADYVVKVAQPDGPLAPYDVKHEADMMRLAVSLGVAAPEVVGCSVSPDGDCDFIVMKHVAGASPSIWEAPQWIAEAGPEFRLQVGRSLIQSLKPLRRLPEAQVLDLPQHYRAYLSQIEDDVGAAADGLLHLPTTFARVGDWLRSRCDELEAPPALHHGDFRLGNAVFQDGAVAALLDWERAMIGHPLHDLGYFGLPAMKTDDLICGVMTEAELAGIYQEEFGEPLDLRLCSYFRIMSMFTEFCAMTRALARLAKGHGRLNGARTLPLVARLHYDLLVAIREWTDGKFHL